MSEDKSKEKVGSRVPDKGKELDVTALPQKYKVIVKGTEIFGHSFLLNIQKIANLGGVIDTSHLISNKFPHSCVMLLETSEPIETNMGEGIEVIPVVAALSEGELKALSWESFKSVCKKQFGITGRDRHKMTEEYLAKVEEQNNK